MDETNSQLAPSSYDGTGRRSIRLGFLGRFRPDWRLGPENKASLEETTLLGTGTYPFVGPFEDDFPLPKVGYVIVPLRVASIFRCKLVRSSLQTPNQ